MDSNTALLSQLVGKEQDLGLQDAIPQSCAYCRIFRTVPICPVARIVAASTLNPGAFVAVNTCFCPLVNC
jgi:hypothetical protein